MTDGTIQGLAAQAAAVGAASPPAVDEVAHSIQGLETRLTELENVVHSLAHMADPSTHGVVLPWLEKIGARIKAAVEKVL